MRDFLAGYSIQQWLESCPQGYLENTDFGHAPGENEPELLLESPALLEQAISLTVQLVAGERCALAASSGLINSAPDSASKIFLATQTLDEARHVEIFDPDVCYDLGVKKRELEDTLKQLRESRTWSSSPRSCWRRSTRATSSPASSARTSSSRAWPSRSSR